MNKQQFDKLQEKLSSIEHHEYRIKMARHALKNELTSMGYEFKSPITNVGDKDLTLIEAENLARTLVEEVGDSITKKAEDEKRAAAEREAAAKAKTLANAMKKAKDLGLEVIKRPTLNFGTTQDHSYRIIALGPKDEKGVMVALIWNGGASWSDNGGQHYGESDLSVSYVTYNDRNQLVYTRWGGESAFSHKDLPNGGKISAKRLAEIEPLIQKVIPGYKAAIVPWEFTLVYPAQEN